ncbi:hypothetical protein PQR02_20250 [Paraburkholderia sediminicola]|uniref:Uncharacterized protein n=1 Tax=Paraburkholderia rhynchosiae TaxID=487049 RepID=A0ACC7NJI0_9BURK
MESLARADMSQWPHVLLCDIVLADEDGDDVLRRLRALEAEREIPLQSRLPAVALTGYTDAEDRKTAEAAGFQTLLGKPVSTGG